jgi:hypothetical protein
MTRQFDLDHIGAEVRQDLRRPRPGEDAGQVQHLDAFQRARVHRRAPASIPRSDFRILSSPCILLHSMLQQIAGPEP